MMELEQILGKTVSVFWDDIVAAGTWVSADNIRAECKTTTFQTIGILIDIQDNFITIAGTWEHDMSTYGDCNSIPKGVIKNISILAIPMIEEIDAD